VVSWLASSRFSWTRLTAGRALLDELVQHGGEPAPGPREGHRPTLLRGCLDLRRAMKRTHLDRRIVERINLAVDEWLSCDYCLVAHTRAARQPGVPASEIQLARQGTSSDPGIAAILAFAQQVLAAPDEIGDADADQLRAHGYRDEQIAEVAGLVALQLLTGAFNLIADIRPTPEALAEITAEADR
jgi:AhpD family alkylhydroperoxidase